MNWSNKWGEPQDGATIKFVLNHEDCRIASAIKIGDLALEYDDDGWEMYHVPTLTKFSKAVPGNFMKEPNNDSYEKDQLLNWMKKVQENYPTSWQMLRLLTPQNYNDKGQQAKDIILNWCLSVKVE